VSATAAGASGPGDADRRAGAWHIRLIGAAVLAALVLLVALQPPWAERLQSAGFDALQSFVPRQVGTLPVSIVEIDQKSLRALGQWPWPRNLLAQLVDRINQAAPAVIALNILMPEPDALSPEHLFDRVAKDDKAQLLALRTWPSNDTTLARALAAAPSVLAVAGLPEATGMPLHAVPVSVRNSQAGHTAPLAVAHFAGALTSLDEIDRQADGWGLMSADATRGVLRRIPLVASIDGTLLPTLAVEMLRVATGVPALRLDGSGARVRGIAIGQLRYPTESDGALRVYYSKHRADRFVSAVDVMQGRVDAAQLHRQLVIVGLTGVGLLDYQATPLGERLSGSEIQAQLLENLVDGSWLRRPGWAPLAEAGALLLLGLWLLWVVPRWRVTRATLALLGCLALTGLLAFASFRSQRLLLDAALPGLSLLLLFGTLLALSLAESAQQRRSLESVLQRQREDGARLAGELQAAQRIQTENLPRPDALHGDSRVELQALLQPAREVGGDLYDYFLLDANRLLLLIGDVAGKGLSASIFMAVSKALCKSAMLREPGADIGDMISAANAEISRDNPQNLFVSAFAAILDLHSGELAYCNAGHDNPYRLLPGAAPLRRIEDGDGPPLCAVPGYAYRGARCRMTPGEMLCLMTDGVTDAEDEHGRMFGAAGVQRELLRLAGLAQHPRGVVEGLRAALARFVGDAEAADDLTLLVLRWVGPDGGGA